MTSKPVIIFVPGAWHTPSAFDLLLPSLHKAGYQTTGIFLASVGGKAEIQDFYPDVALIRSVVGGLVEILGRDVVVVSHSYGGSPTTEAMKGLSKRYREAQGLPGGVVKLIYISAGVPVEGHSFIESLGEDHPGTEMVFHEDGTTTPKYPVRDFYNDLSPDLAQYYVGLLQRQVVKVFFTPVTYVAYRDIPAAYLLCTKDQAIGIEFQRRIVENTGITETEELDASHSPFLSRPEAVVRFIRRVLE